MVEALLYKLRMFGLPMYVSDNMFYNKNAFYNNTTTPESVLNKKPNSISYHSFSGSLDFMTIIIYNQVNDKNTYDSSE